VKGAILTVRNLKTWFPMRGGILQRISGYLKAVDDVSFDVLEGETLGLVGESGAGKTTVANTLLRLVPHHDGEAYFKDTEIFSAKGRDLRNLRRSMQIIFQDPYASLDPRQTVMSMLMEVLRTHRIVSVKSEAREKALELLNKVGMTEEHLFRYPHEFSGGQRQRIAVARALALDPVFMFLDEPTSFLDVSVQASALNLLKDLQADRRLTYVFISHNLSVVRYMSDRIAVMYLGKVVEIADKGVIYVSPEHPYTYFLMAAIPVPDPTFKRKEVLLTGDIPSPVNAPSGCHFRTRCPFATDRCAREDPPLTEIRAGHWVACHYVGSMDFEKIGVASAGTAA